MPARRDFTPEELHARLERRREQVRAAVARHRARKPNAVSSTSDPVTLTTAQGAAGKRNPPTPPVSSLLLKKKIEHLLSGYAPRGYRHDPRFWELLRERYPRLDLELEVMKLAEWLDEPRNAKRKCSKAFLSNWMGKAETDRQQREQQAHQAPPGLKTVGMLPAAPGKPPDPEPVFPADTVLEPIDLSDYQRVVTAARKRSFEERLAGFRNGAPR